MCWSFAASIIFTTLGLAAATYLILKKDDKYLWIPFIYFALMELLQVFTYLYLNKCDLPINQVLTYLGYLHIVFQPFFFNMIFMHFIPAKVRSRISGYVYAVCFASAILMLLKTYPFAWAEPCRAGVDMLCGANLCAVSGSWHLAWMVPWKNLGLVFSYAYIFSVFILPFIYGAWRVNLFQMLAGPVLVRFFASSPNEFPAVWCLFSIAIFFAIFIPKLRKWFYVKKWYLWDYPKLLNK
jgi:hypothetical protein